MLDGGRKLVVLIPGEACRSFRVLEIELDRHFVKLGVLEPPAVVRGQLDCFAFGHRANRSPRKRRDAVELAVAVGDVAFFWFRGRVVDLRSPACGLGCCSWLGCGSPAFWLGCGSPVLWLGCCSPALWLSWRSWPGWGQARVAGAASRGVASCGAASLLLVSNMMLLTASAFVVDVGGLFLLPPTTALLLLAKLVKLERIGVVGAAEDATELALLHRGR